MGNFLREHWRERRGGYLLGLAALGLGLLLGVLGSKLLSLSQQTDLLNYLNGLATAGLKGNSPQFWVAAATKEVIILYLAGVSLIGLPLLLGLVAVRGFVLGFSLSFLLQEFGSRAWALLGAVLLPDLLILPPLLLWVASALRLLVLVLRAQLGRQPTWARRALGEYHRTALGGLVIFWLASFLRDYLHSITYGLLVGLFR